MTNISGQDGEKKYNHKMLFVKERREIEKEALELYKQPKELKKIFELEKKIFKNYIVDELKKRHEFLKKEKENYEWWGKHYSELEKKRNSFLPKEKVKQLSCFKEQSNEQNKNLFHGNCRLERWSTSDKVR